ncbi:clavesin-1, partial [Caerostris extrusa]
ESPNMGSREEFYDAVEEQEDPLDDLNETEELRRRCLHELREWAKSQPHFVNCRLANSIDESGVSHLCLLIDNKGLLATSRPMRDIVFHDHTETN